MRAELLTAVNTNMKLMVFWDLTLCSLIDRYKRFGEAFCHCLHGRREIHVGKFEIQLISQHG
jgi:hypothetical protein